MMIHTRSSAGLSTGAICFSKKKANTDSSDTSAFSLGMKSEASIVLDRMRRMQATYAEEVELYRK